MVNLEELKVRGLRAYEAGRWFSASRVAFFIIPLTGFCLLESRGRETCACLSIILLVSAVWLRWRDGRGKETVTTGLMAGAIPLAAGVISGCLDVECGLAGAGALCTVFGVLVGAGAGIVIAFRQTRWHSRWWSFVTAAGIASLAAGLGFVRLGWLGAMGMLMGIGLGTLAGAVITGRSVR